MHCEMLPLWLVTGMLKIKVMLAVDFIYKNLMLVSYNIKLNFKYWHADFHVNLFKLNEKSVPM